MILIKDVTVDRIDNFYKLKCSQTLLEAEGYGLQKVAKELHQKDKDRDLSNAMAASHSRSTYTTARSSARFV